MGQSLDQTMCTTDCPCDIGLRDNWGLFHRGDKSANGLRKWKRATKEIPTAQQKADGMKGMKFVKSGGI